VSGNGFQPEPALRCPVCQARFRESSECYRCGANLMPLMLLVAHAYSHREAARRSLRTGNIESALADAQAAQKLHPTPQGRILEMVCAAGLLSPVLASSPPDPEPTPCPAGREAESPLRSAAEGEQALPGGSLPQPRRSGASDAVPWKALFLGATAALFVFAVHVAWGHHRQST
jgi:hypothetical protein